MWGFRVPWRTQQLFSGCSDSFDLDCHRHLEKDRSLQTQTYVFLIGPVVPSVLYMFLVCWGFCHLDDTSHVPLETRGAKKKTLVWCFQKILTHLLKIIHRPCEQLNIGTIFSLSKEPCIYTLMRGLCLHVNNGGHRHTLSHLDRNYSDWRCQAVYMGCDIMHSGVYVQRRSGSEHQHFTSWANVLTAPFVDNG